MLNNTQQNIPWKLKPRHQLAVDLRVSGCSYLQIAADTRVNSKEQTVRSWFMRGGICFETFEYKIHLLQEDRAARIRQVEAGIQDLAFDAIRVLKEYIATSNLKAAIKVLEMAGFKEVQKIEEIPFQEDEGILLLRQIIMNRRSEARKKMNENNSQKLIPTPQI